MPPRPRITEEMIVNAAFELVQTEGPDKITAQAAARALGCSTQPVMSHFKKVDDLRKAVVQKADAYHSACLMAISGQNPMLEIGMNYIRFAKEEKNLFRLLFQSDAFSGQRLRDSLEAPELRPVLDILANEAGISAADAKRAFKALFLVVHGYASLFAANDMAYDETEIASDLTLIFEGTLRSFKERTEYVSALQE